MMGNYCSALGQWKLIVEFLVLSHAREYQSSRKRNSPIRFSIRSLTSDVQPLR